MSRDNWERLVAAVLKREQLWQLFHQQSTSSSNISTSSSDFTDEQISSFSASPSPPIPSENIFVSQDSNHASGPLKRKLLSAWSHRRKTKDLHLVDIPVRRFSLHELQIATDNFGSKIKYGYSMVYRGILENGRHVAVKRYRKRGNENAEEKFMEEVQKNSIALHPCVLNMVGLCTTANENLIVYPLMVNGSVESCLRGRQTPLDWPTRKRIAVGVARGVAYLHDECEKKIIHRDIKAANVLLDDEFEAVIGDMELAIIMEDNTTSYSSTSIVGTIGHIIAPDNYTTYTWSERSDILCYGVFLLELITGLRVFDLARIANDEDMKLLDWIKRKYMKRKWMNMVDTDCGGNYKDEVVEQLMQIALICTQTSPHECLNMSQVVTMLEIGHGLSERWQVWYRKEAAEMEENDHLVDDDMAEEELSGPR